MPPILPEWPTSRDEGFRYLNFSALKNLDETSTHCRLPNAEPLANFTFPIATPLTKRALTMPDAGWLVRVPAGSRHTFNLAFANEGAAPRVKIVVEAGAELTLHEEHTTPPSQLVNMLLDIELGAGAHVTHTRYQHAAPTAFHLSTTHVTQAEQSRYAHTALTTGGQLSRHELHIKLAGPKAEGHVHTLQAVTANQQADFTSVITHASPDCRSHEIVRSAVSGSARASFQGKIVVDPLAQKTDAAQLSKALLLSRTAEANAKPELEILADDVKCSHGSTVGALDEQALFYLMARGLSPVAARALLIEAFLTEGLLECSHLRAAITNWLGAHYG